MNLTWYTAGTDNPMDEQADLMAGYWAIIGPEAGGRFDWTVVAPDGADIAGGNADSAEAAKVAVVEWFRQSVYYSVGRTDTPPPGLVPMRYVVIYSTDPTGARTEFSAADDSAAWERAEQGAHGARIVYLAETQIQAGGDVRRALHRAAHELAGLDTSHVATYAADGDGYLVTCPEGCKLGTSEHQLTEAGALRRIELHKISTTRLLP